MPDHNDDLQNSRAAEQHTHLEGCLDDAVLPSDLTEWAAFGVCRIERLYTSARYIVRLGSHVLICKQRTRRYDRNGFHNCFTCALSTV